MTTLIHRLKGLTFPELFGSSISLVHILVSFLLAHAFYTLYIKKELVDESSRLFESTFSYEPAPNSPLKTIPKILLWTPFFRHSYLWGFQQKQCPYKCQYENRFRMDESEADAIIFHTRNVKNHGGHLPEYRRPDQYYVAFIQEPPHLVGRAIHGINPLPVGFFNVTLDYRFDPKTYYWGFGKLKRKEYDNEDQFLTRKSDRELDDLYYGKETMALAMISNCRLTPSGRGPYITELSNLIDTTFVGLCFHDKPMRGACKKYEELECEDRLMSKHYFFLAFENSICKDYVSEKFFRGLGKIIPIVLRRSVYKNIAPNSAYIAADDFANPAELAAYLEKVANDRELYKSYFIWMNDHYLHDTNIGICDFCRDLHFRNVSTRPNLDMMQYYSFDECEVDTGMILLNSTASGYKHYYQS